MVEPIIVNDTTGNIVGGHQRLKVLIEDGIKSTDVVVVELPESEERALNVTLNNPHITGDFTEDLQLILADIKIEMPTDYIDMRLDELWIDTPVEGLTDPDVVPDVPEEPIAQRGQIFRLGEHRLMCGDSTDADDVARLMDGKKAELLFTSPPYSDMRDYGGDNLSVDHLCKFIPTHFEFAEYQVINLGLQRKDNEIVQYWDAYIKTAKDAGYKFLSWNIWNKTIGGSMASATAMFLMVHEWIFVFGKDAKKLNRTIPNQLDKYEARRGKNWRDGSPEKSIRSKDGSMKTTSSATYTHHQLPSVLIQTPELSDIRKMHPAIYPVAFPQSYIEAMTNELEIVIDPFLGSGSTLIACEKLSRICYGMEIDPHYCDVIIKRWEDFTGQTATLEADMP